MKKIKNLSVQWRSRQSHHTKSRGLLVALLENTHKRRGGKERRGEERRGRGRGEERER